MVRFNKGLKYRATAIREFKARPDKVVDLPIQFRVSAKNDDHADRLARSELKRLYRCDWRDLKLERVG